VRAADGQQDAAIYLTAAFTGLRLGDLLALRCREVDFGGSLVRVRSSYSAGRLSTPKSGKIRSVPPSRALRPLRHRRARGMASQSPASAAKSSPRRACLSRHA